MTLPQLISEPPCGSMEYSRVLRPSERDSLTASLEFLRQAAQLSPRNDQAGRLGTEEKAAIPNLTKPFLYSLFLLNWAIIFRRAEFRHGDPVGSF